MNLKEKIIKEKINNLIDLKKLKEIEKYIYKEIRKKNYEYLNNYISIKSNIDKKNKKIKFFIEYNYNYEYFKLFDLNKLRYNFKKKYNNSLISYNTYYYYDYNLKDNIIKLEINIMI